MESERKLRTDFCRRIKENEVYIGNLPTDITEESLMENFQDFDQLTFISLHKNGLKTYCFIDCGSAQNAVQFQRLMNGLEVEGRKLCIRWQNDGTKIEYRKNRDDNCSSSNSSTRKTQINNRLIPDRSKETASRYDGSQAPRDHKVLSSETATSSEVDIPPLKPAMPFSIRDRATGRKHETSKQDTYDEEDIPPLKPAQPSATYNTFSTKKHATTNISTVYEKEAIPPLKPMPCNKQSGPTFESYSPRGYSPSHNYAASCDHVHTSPNSHYPQQFRATERQFSRRYAPQFSRRDINERNPYSSKPYASPQMYYEEEEEDEEYDVDIPEGAVVLSVANFPYRTTEEMIFILFEDFEPIDVVMLCNYPDANGITEAYVIVPNQEKALDAIMNLDNTQYRHRTLLVTEPDDKDILNELRSIQDG